MRRFAYPEPLVSALSALSAAVFGVGGSQEAAVSVQKGCISTMNQSQATDYKVINVVQSPVQTTPYSATARPFFGSGMSHSADWRFVVAADQSLGGGDNSLRA
jgi:hypothetical protein